MRGIVLLGIAVLAHGQYKAVNPKVAKIVGEVSEERITATLKKLESFGTRQISSRQDDPNGGVGAARKWIYEQFKSYSPRLEVSYDQYRLKAVAGANSRVPKDVDLYNIVAVLPGTIHKEQRVYVTAHYDTIQIAARTGAALAEGQAAPVADMDAPSPGVTDDGSGTACVMELARIMSQYEFDKTLVFVTFAGEEEGLLGASLYAAKAKKENQNIEALLNNDIIGSDVSGSGRTENRRVNVYSTDPLDSGPRTVARYFKEIAERYVPSMGVNLVFREDRVGRGGDHTPFAIEGFPAVRITTPQEDYSHQHTPTDTFEFTSVPYTARVTRLNGAVAASLAWAPTAPETMDNRTLLLTRGQSTYDAMLRWKHTPEPDLLGYVVVVRATTAPYWEREVFIPSGNEYTMTDVNIDEFVIGVKAVDREGNESLVSPYVPNPRPKRVVETY
jgi:Zn-dependent M28 family amino/carboxypeptidase